MALVQTNSTTATKEKTNGDGIDSFSFIFFPPG